MWAHFALIVWFVGIIVDELRLGALVREFIGGCRILVFQRLVHGLRVIYCCNRPRKHERLCSISMRVRLGLALLLIHYRLAYNINASLLLNQVCLCVGQHARWLRCRSANVLSWWDKCASCISCSLRLMLGKTRRLGQSRIKANHGTCALTIQRWLPLQIIKVRDEVSHLIATRWWLNRRI